MPKTAAARKSTRPRGWKPWQRRLSAALIFIFSLLMVLGLLTGPQALSDDMTILKEAGGALSWFSAARENAGNPVGVFGILLGNLFVFLLGYLFSIVSFVIIGIIALQYFLDPDAPKARQKALLILIVISCCRSSFQPKTASWALPFCQASSGAS